MFLRLEFLTGSGFSSWNSSGVQVFGISHGGCSSRTCILDRGCADIKWNSIYLEFLCSLLTDFNVSILLACFGLSFALIPRVSQKLLKNAIWGRHEILAKRKVLIKMGKRLLFWFASQIIQLRKNDGGELTPR